MSGIAFSESGARPAAGTGGLASGRLRRAGLWLLFGLVPVVALVGLAAGPASAARWDADKLGKVLRISPSINPESVTGTAAPRSEPEPNFKVLDLAGSSAADGAAIQTWNANDTEAQRWYVDHPPKPPGKEFQISQGYAIRNIKTGKCLDVQGGNNAEGTRVIQWPCHWGLNQLWALNGGYVRSLVNVTTTNDNPLPYSWFSNFDGPGLKLGMHDGDPAVITYGTPTRLSFDESGYWARTPRKVVEGWSCYPTACDNGVSSAACQGGYLAGGSSGWSGSRWEPSREPWIESIGSDKVGWYGSRTGAPPVLSGDNTSLSGFYFNKDIYPRAAEFRAACFAW
jgi:Ricin-type beta-trefoil lectin domain-like